MSDSTTNLQPKAPGNTLTQATSDELSALFTPEGYSTETKYANFWTGAWRRFRRNPLAMYGLVYASIIIVVAILAPLLTPYRYDQIT